MEGQGTLTIGEGMFSKAKEWWDAATPVARVAMLKEIGYVDSDDLSAKRFEEIPWSTRHDLGPAVQEVLRKF